MDVHDVARSFWKAHFGGLHDMAAAGTQNSRFLRFLSYINTLTPIVGHISQPSSLPITETLTLIPFGDPWLTLELLVD